MSVLRYCMITSLLVILLAPSFDPFLYIYTEALPARSPYKIYADGTFTAGAPITRSGSNYRLTDDITSGIEIDCSNIVFDGSGFTLSSDSGVGIYIIGMRNITISNHTIRDTSEYGIQIVNSRELTIIDNLFEYNSGYSLHFKNCINNFIIRNNFNNNTLTMSIHSSSENSRVDGCIFKDNGGGIGFGVGARNLTLVNSVVENTTQYGFHSGIGNGIFIDNCTFRRSPYFQFNCLTDASNIFINNTRILDGVIGMALTDVKNCTIAKTTFGNNVQGAVSIHRSSDVIVDNISIIGGSGAISISDSSNITVSRSSVRNNNLSIAIGCNQVRNFTFRENSLENNKNLLILKDTSDGIISRNTFRNSNCGISSPEWNTGLEVFENEFYQCESGIWLTNIGESRVYHNNEFNPNGSASLDPSCSFDDGYPSGGNYWAFYDEASEGAFDVDNDGIADVPLGFDNGKIYDRYPLIRPFGTNPPIANFTYFIDNSTVTFDAANTFDRDGRIVEYLWDLGDGKTDTGRSVGHLYDEDGTYDVSLKATDDDGCVDHCNLTQMIMIEDRPRLVSDLSDIFGTTGDPFKFKIEAWDNFGVEEVSIQWTHGLDNGALFLEKDGGLWSGQMDLGDRIDDLVYVVHIQDGNGMSFTSSSKEIPVLDNDPPRFLEDHSDPYGVVDEPFNLRASVSDNIQVSELNVECRLNGLFISNSSMISGQDGNWSYELNGIRTPGKLEYTFHMLDASGNYNRSSSMEAMIYLSDGPIFNSIVVTEDPYTGGTWEVRTTVTDNFGIEKVLLEYRFNSDNTRTENMFLRGLGTWNISLDIPLDAVSLNYRLIATDTSGNTNQTGMAMTPVLDIVDPVIADLTSSTPETGDPFNILWSASDNIGVSEVMLEYWFGDGEHQNLSVGEQDGGNFSIEVPDDSLSPLNYILSVSDLSNRTHVLTLTTINIVDDEGPTIDDRTSGIHQRGEELSFYLNITDNVGIKAAFLEYRYSSDNGMEIITLEEGNPFSITPPFGNLDDIRYRVTARDTYGNENTTNEKTVVLTDRIEGDHFPNDPAASLDSDSDGFPDEWNPGLDREHSTTGLRLDAFPNDPAASLDTDGDGYPDEWNAGLSKKDSTTGLSLDEFPDNPKEWRDSDGDEIGDNSDRFPHMHNTLGLIIFIIIIVIVIFSTIALFAVMYDKKRFTRSVAEYNGLLKEMEERGMDASGERQMLDGLKVRTDIGPEVDGIEGVEN
ncbi:MAG: right-handed parallel beta-helix repeat-containing protein [Candidatus Thermoplasmatota archaeon]|nr:right-handed parallel beta-helix repeat-containing protein [Candidatus Thermoplasmatota archaeon]